VVRRYGMLDLCLRYTLVNRSSRCVTRFSLASRNGTIKPDVRGCYGFTNMISRSNRREDVRILQLVRERTWQPRGGSSVLSVNQKLLERLEAENAQLRDCVVDLMLQIQALRDDAR
jgi:hypothetical protein